MKRICAYSKNAISGPCSGPCTHEVKGYFRKGNTSLYLCETHAKDYASWHPFEKRPTKLEARNP